MGKTSMMRRHVFTLQAVIGVSVCFAVGVCMDMAAAEESGPVAGGSTEQRGGAEGGDAVRTEAPLVQMAPVVVTATRAPKPLTLVPGAVSVVEQKQILQGRPATGVDETLRYAPGVQAERRFGPDDVRISIRGSGVRSTFGVRSIRVLIDGIPLTEVDGQTRLEPIDLDAVARVEVLRGPNSTLYGNASAGVINYVLEEGEKDNRYAEPRFVFGAYDFYKYRLKSAGATDRFGWMANYSYLDYGGYRDHSTTRNQRFLGKFKYTINDRSDLSLVVTYGQLDGDIPGNLTMTQFRTNPRQQQQTLHAIPPATFPANTPFAAFQPARKDERFRPAVVYRNQFSENQEFSLTGFFGTRDLHHPLCCFPASFITLTRVENAAFAKYTNTVPFFGLPNRLIVGYDWQDQNSVNKNFDNVLGSPGALRVYTQERISQDGFYAQDELSILEQVELVGGVRYSQVRFKIDDRLKAGGIDGSSRRNFAQTTGLAGVRYSPVKWANFYFNFGQSFETPTGTEFRNPTTPTGVGLNPFVQPQKSSNYELGVKGAVGETLYYDFAIYRQHFSDELIQFSTGFTGACSIFAPCFRNAGKTDHDGFEVGLAYKPLRALTIQVAYTYADYRFRDYVVNGVQLAGRRLPGIPEHRLIIDATYEQQEGLLAGAFAGVEWQYQTAYFVSDTNLDSVSPTGTNPQNDRKNPGYTVTTLKGGYKAMLSKHWGLELFGRLENIFDANYAFATINPASQPAFGPFIGRNVFSGFSLRYAFM
ncbi:MAG: TonB-dependent receptor [Nitrospirota bacterium]